MRDGHADLALSDLADISVLEFRRDAHDQAGVRITTSFDGCCDADLVRFVVDQRCIEAVCEQLGSYSFRAIGVEDRALIFIPE